MHRLNQRTVYLSLLLITIIGFGPGAVTAQTPAALDNTGFEITVLGVSRYQETSAELDRNGEPIARNHALLEVTMNSGVTLPAFIGTQSAVIHVMSGSLQVAVANGETSVNLANPAPEACAEESCEVEPNQAVVLEAGDTISLADASFEVEATGEDLTVFQMTILVPLDGLRNRCWICPVIG